LEGERCKSLVRNVYFPRAGLFHFKTHLQSPFKVFNLDGIMFKFSQHIIYMPQKSYIEYLTNFLLLKNPH